MKQVIIYVGFPRPALNPNSREHRMKVANATKAARREAWICGKVALERQRPPLWVHAQVHAVCQSARRIDPDNLARMLKPTIDGLVDAGILADDDQIEHRVEWVKGKPGVEITVTPKEEDHV